MKKILLTVACLAAFGAQAHDNHCEVEINGSMELADKTLTLTTKRGKEVVINPDHSLVVDGEVVDLDSAQMRLVSDYYLGIEKAVPEAYELAQSAVNLAGQGVTEAFGEIIGEDDDLIVDISEFFDEIQTDLKQEFYAQDGSIRFHFGDETDEDFLSPEIEQKIEDKLGSLVERSIGKLLIAIGTQISSGSNGLSFEDKMERFGDTLEEKMEFESDLLADSAQNLCSQLAEVDKIEEQMQDEIRALRRFDVLHASAD